MSQFPGIVILSYLITSRGLALHRLSSPSGRSIQMVDERLEDFLPTHSSYY